jgi:guanine nucleotide-binding protein subunit alpha
MRLIHKVPFSSQEIEFYRQLVFDNVTRGIRYILDAMDEFEMKVSEENVHNVEIVDNAKDVGDGEPFPVQYIEPLKALWVDPNIQRAYERGNEAALPEKYVIALVASSMLFTAAVV